MSMRRDTHVVFESLVADATMAASSHNTQPWRFEIGENLIRIVPDFTRRCPMVDPDDHHLYVSLGCAAENMVLAAASKGWDTAVEVRSSGNAHCGRGHAPSRYPGRISLGGCHPPEAVHPSPLRRTSGVRG
jgi:hypothetical protein